MLRIAFAASALAASALFAQPQPRLVAAVALQSAPIDSPSVMDADKSFVYVGSSNGRLFVFDHSGRLVQTQDVVRNLYYDPSSDCRSAFGCGRYLDLNGPITAVASSTDPNRYLLYVAAENAPDAGGAYVVRYPKFPQPPVIRDSSGIAQIADTKDVAFRGMGIFGFDMPYGAVRRNAELNPYVSAAHDKDNVYVSSGFEPARAYLNGTLAPLPDRSAYKPDSTVVYDRATGAVKSVLSNEAIGCAANVYSDGTLLFRACPALNGKGFLVDRVGKIAENSPTFYEKPGARVAATATKDGVPTIAYVGTSFGEVLRYRVKDDGSLEELSPIDIEAASGGARTEQYVTAYGDSVRYTDSRVVAIRAVEDALFVLTVPRWPTSGVGCFFCDTSGYSPAKLLIFK